MPEKMTTRCAYPNCPLFPEGGERYCRLHKQEKNQQADARRERDDRYKSSRWERTRTRVLTVNPLCRECLRQGYLSASREVDHVVPVKNGGEFWDDNNLQALCKSCHSRKTRRENR